MNTLYRVPLEVLPERYTEQWSQWLPREFGRLGFDYKEIPGESITSEVETGKVLDASGTMYFKFSQLQRIASLFKKNLIKNNDSFFIDDIQFPGIWAIKYMAELYNVKVKIYGFLHASSYTKEDFAEPMTPFLKSVERSWLFTYDKIFVGSQYHKDTFIKKRFQHAYKKEARNKLVVTGAPWNVWTAQSIAYRSPAYSKCKKHRVIFPNRFDIEKRPNVFLMLADYVYNVLEIKDLEFLIVTSRKTLTKDKNLQKMLDKAVKKIPSITVKTNLKKHEYYAYLAESKLMVSTTIEENFGYCVIEALSLNIPVLVPDKYSHPELLCEVKDKYYMLHPNSWEAYRDNFTFPTEKKDLNIHNLSMSVLSSVDYLKDDDTLYESVLRYNNSIENMALYMKGSND